MFIIPQMRQEDKHGFGYYGAPRNGRTHKGIDFACPVGTKVVSHIDGIVTKYGYPYGDDLSFRYIEIIDKDDFLHRVFYIDLLIGVGSIVEKGDIIGETQRLSKRYPCITEHFHYEVIKMKNNRKEFFDPLNFLEI